MAESGREGEKEEIIPTLRWANTTNDKKKNALKKRWLSSQKLVKAEKRAFRLGTHTRGKRGFRTPARCQNRE